MATEVESPYTIQEVCKLTGLSPRVITQLFEQEPGVIVFEQSNPQRKRKSYRSIRIPRRVFERVMRRHTAQ